MDLITDLVAHIDGNFAGYGPAVVLTIGIIAFFALLGLLRRIPVIGGLVSLISWVVIAGLILAAVTQRQRFDPAFAQIFGELGAEPQRVEGKETRIRMARDGHFWAVVDLDGVERRMLIDSGATVTALSAATAKAANLKFDQVTIPIVVQTANGAVPVRAATVKRLKLGNIRADEVSVVVTPGMNTDVIGMNFLSRLKGWRVEDRTLILSPHHPQATAA